MATSLTPRDGIHTLPLRDLDDVADIERTPIADRLAARSTYELLGIAAGRFSDRPALTDMPDGCPGPRDRTWSYTQLFESITRAANCFHELGVRPDQAVSLLLPNLPAYQYTLWGAEAAGIANPINPLLEAGAIAAIARLAGSTILVTVGPEEDEDLWQRAMQAARDVPTISHVLVISDNEVPPPDGCLSLAAGMREASGEAQVFDREWHHSDTASYFHTGGTTGAPKLVCHTHGNEISNAWQSAHALALSDEDVILNGLPLFHGVGAMLLSLAPLSLGAHVVMAGALGFRNPDALRGFWGSVAHHRVSIFSAVPTVYSALLECPLNGADINSLRFGVCGAAPMPAYVFRKFEETTGIKILEGYGMTETCAASTLNPRDGTAQRGSVGIRVPYQEVRIAILDDQENFVRDATPGESGVLLLKGPNVTPGYLPTTANDNAWPCPGWLNSGDTARLDDDGYLYLTGRRKDLIIRSGHNIDPAVVENALADHPAVASVAVVGQPDAYAGELPVAYVVLHAGASATPEELREHARHHVAERTAKPAAVFVIKHMPTTAVGKIFKPDLRADAVRRASERLLCPVLDSLSYRVTVDIHTSHGLVVRVEVNRSRDKRLATAIEETMSHFSHRCEIVWKSPGR